MKCLNPIPSDATITIVFPPEIQIAEELDTNPVGGFYMNESLPDFDITNG